MTGLEFCLDCGRRRYHFRISTLLLGKKPVVVLRKKPFQNRLGVAFSLRRNLNARAVLGLAYYCQPQSRAHTSFCQNVSHIG